MFVDGTYTNVLTFRFIVLCCVQVVAEGANGPTTITAEKILHERKVLVIPVSTKYMCSLLCDVYI